MAITEQKKEKLKEAKNLLRKDKEKYKTKQEFEISRALRDLEGTHKELYFYEILDKYLKGAKTKDLALEYHYPEYKIAEMITMHHKDLVNARSAHALASTNKQGNNIIIDKLKATEVINEDFMLLLSQDTSSTLSESEALYAWIYVHRGDTEEAIEMSGLQVGLYKTESATYKRGLMARSFYLQNKPNVSKYIKELREQKFYADDVDKRYVQELILEQIDQLRQQGTKRDIRTLSKMIELLGKTIGAFTEKIEISEVDPSKSLDLLIQMAKEAQVSEIPLTPIESIEST